jgi:hypothetical protein
MRDNREVASMTPDRRRDAIVRILAAGVLRLHTRAALTVTTTSPENPVKSAPNCLELGGDSRLTVHGS